MTTKPPIPLANEFLHSHSDLTRQVEELEAHACALRCSEDDTTDVLEALVEFAQRFSAEVHEHIAEEEEVLFPQCYPYLTASARTLLHRIRNQHRDLEKSLQRFMEYLDEAREQPHNIHEYLSESICLRARLLRYTLAVHSDEERRFFEEVCFQ